MPQFMDPRARVAKWSDRLPHWSQSGATYFVTIRLADSIPAGLLREWQREREIWLHHHPEPWTKEAEREYFDRFPRRMERWLDENHGEALFRKPQFARIVADALQHFDGDRYEQICWVVMPNHAHALFAVNPPHDVGSVVHSWKSYTAHVLNRMLGRSGPLWQRDYFDRLIRDEDHLLGVADYIRRNPIKAKLRPTEFLAYSRCQKEDNRD